MTPLPSVLPPPAYRSFHLSIVSATDTEIKGSWYNDEGYPREWLDYTYTKIPGTVDRWDGKFTLVSRESMEMAIGTVVQPNEPERKDIEVSLKIDSPVQFHEYNVQIRLTKTKGKVTGITGAGINRYGSFSLESKTTAMTVVAKVVDPDTKVARDVVQGTTTRLHLSKTYHTVHRMSLKRTRGLDSSTFIVEKRKRSLANAIRSSLKDKRYDLEQKVLAGEMNFPEVIAALDEPSKKALQKKVNLLVWSARQRSINAFMSRYMERQRLTMQIRAMHEQIDKITKVASIK